MNKILLILPDLEYSGAAKEVAIIASVLPHVGFAPHICILGSAGPAIDWLEGSGAPLTVLRGRRSLDLGMYAKLRRLVRDIQPDVIHTGGSAAFRAIALVAGRGPHRVVARSPLTARANRRSLGRWERWLLGRADRVLARGPLEAERWRAFGLPAQIITILPPPAETVGTRSRPPASPLHALCDPEQDGGKRLIVCAGRLEVHRGYRDALWALSLLPFLYEDLRLAIAGSGPDRPGLEYFSGVTDTRRIACFVGPRSDLSEWLARAELVWVPSRAEGGVHVALEAMALGRPVVAARLPGLADVITDGESGYLVPPGDVLALARQTHLLLSNPDLRRRMGEAGRRRAAARFTRSAFVNRVAELYQTLARTA